MSESTLSLPELHTHGISTGRNETPSDADSFLADMYAAQAQPTDAELEAEYQYFARQERQRDAQAANYSERLIVSAAIAALAAAKLDDATYELIRDGLAVAAVLVTAA